ncbi:MAG: hypothetical protein RIC19_04570 [Phaeodactylibacter sp.]|uniref:hypothetical protein n=1 Tax=Phaeodactylibacter sp. TaxID=1940289 RepID=UPI0032EFD15F
MHYEQAKELLINGKTLEAIDQLREPLQGTPLYDEWMMVRARYETLREREMKGLLSTQESQLEHNRINDAVLRLLDKAEQKDEIPVVRQPEPVPPPPKEARPKWLGWGIAAVVIAGIVLALMYQWSAKPSPQVRETKERVVPKVPSETQKADLKTDITRANPQLMSQYDISKISGNRDIPFEIHTLSKTGEVVIVEMTLHNRTGKPVKLGEMQMVHTGDRSTATSTNLSGTMLQPDEKLTDTFKFRWSIPGEPKAFRMKLDYVIQGGDGVRALKTDFGIYKKIQ